MQPNLTRGRAHTNQSHQEPLTECSVNKPERGPCSSLKQTNEKRVLFPFSKTQGPLFVPFNLLQFPAATNNPQKLPPSGGRGAANQPHNIPKSQCPLINETGTFSRGKAEH